jgi:hypothetical protein
MPEIDQQQDQRHKLREHFIEMFVRDLIINSYDPEKDKALQEKFMKDKLEEMTEELKKSQAVSVVDINQQYLGRQPVSAMPELPRTKFTPNISPSPQEIHYLQKRFGIIEPQMHPSHGPMRMPTYSPIPLPPPTYQPTKFKPGHKIETVNLGKLAGILVDPSVLSIECPGPYKNLLVNRSGSIQTSAITLTPEEINAIMHNVSEQTRIPLTPGVFRAAVQDLIVTAVLSDFVGTRFVIQKRNPFQRY